MSRTWTFVSGSTSMMSSRSGKGSALDACRRSDSGRCQPREQAHATRAPRTRGDSIAPLPWSRGGGQERSRPRRHLYRRALSWLRHPVKRLEEEAEHLHKVEQAGESEVTPFIAIAGLILLPTPHRRAGPWALARRVLPRALNGMAAAEAASYADKGRAVGGPQPGRPTLPRPRSVRLLPTGSGRCGVLRVALGEAAFR